MERIAQFRQYLSDVRAEMKKVVWPTRRETTTTTMVVFGMVIIISLFLWLVDTILALMVQSVIG
jgi:preprotein translocase subunit SecE